MRGGGALAKCAVTVAGSRVACLVAEAARAAFVMHVDRVCIRKGPIKSFAAEQLLLVLGVCTHVMCVIMGLAVRR